MKKLEFFMAMIPPTTTAQERRVAVRNGKPHYYDPPKIKDAKAKLMANLGRFRPRKPFHDVPLRLTVKWLFPTGKKHHNGEYKTTRPDTDNLQKMLKDCMTKCGYWKDDALVCSEICEKFYADTTGIYIKIEELPL